MAEERKAKGGTDFEHAGRIIEDEVRVEATPEVIYHAWADPEAITRWFVDRMDGRMEPGETVTWRWEESQAEMSQRVLVADPPHRLVTAMDLPTGVSYLEVTIRQEGGHSVVRLVQSGFGTGPEWDAQYEAMLSGWMIALGVLKFFAERYLDHRRHEVLLFADAPFEPGQIRELQRTERGVARWLARSGTPGRVVGDPVRLVLDDGRTLTGTVLRTTSSETLWSWDEIGGVVEIKAYQGPHWGSKVGLRVSSWLKDAAELADLEGWLSSVVGRLVAALAGGGG